MKSTIPSSSSSLPKAMESNKQQHANKNKHPLIHLVSGGMAGLVESSICHPLDTIKTRMQLQCTQQHTAAIIMQSKSLHRSSFHNSPSANTNHIKLTSKPGTVCAPLGPFGTAMYIIKREGFSSLYKGLTAVYTGIVPKMAIRFVSFEYYKEMLHSKHWFPNSITTSMAGLLCGLTEAVLVVTPAEVCKIRMQSQYHSMMDPSQMIECKYQNVVQTALTITNEEGMSALYKGVAPTMIRQGVNQSVNFTAYNYMKHAWIEYDGNTKQLEHWKTLMIGGLSGGMGPLVNNPLDVVKTRMQRQIITPSHPAKYTGIIQSCTLIARKEGTRALWKGITPRLMRIMPGQAITFTTYEAVSRKVSKTRLFEDLTATI